MSDSLRPQGLYPARLLCPWDSPGKNTGVGCYFLLQGIWMTQGSNLCLLGFLYWEEGSLPLAPPGKSSIYPLLKQRYICFAHCYMLGTQESV